MALIKNDKEIDAMRESGRMLATVLDRLQQVIDTGITTAEIDTMARRELQALGGQPAFLHYQGFPGAICISVNDEVVHGIPGRYELAAGDLVSLDFGVIYQGMITDSARTMLLGDSTPAINQLVRVTEQSLYKGIEAVKAGNHVGDIGAAVEAYLRRYDLGVVTDLVGHGVGHHVHEPPEIPNVGIAGQGPTLKTGMTIAIEPMATLGGAEVYMARDGWTVRTQDHSPSAHFEHTVLVTDKGYEVVTQS